MQRLCYADQLVESGPAGWWTVESAYWLFCCSVSIMEAARAPGPLLWRFSGGEVAFTGKKSAARSAETVAQPLLLLAAHPYRPAPPAIQLQTALSHPMPETGSWRGGSYLEAPTTRGKEAQKLCGRNRARLTRQKLVFVVRAAYKFQYNNTKFINSNYIIK